MVSIRPCQGWDTGSNPVLRIHQYTRGSDKVFALCAQALNVCELLIFNLKMAVIKADWSCFMIMDSEPEAKPFGLPQAHWLF